MKLVIRLSGRAKQVWIYWDLLVKTRGQETLGEIEGGTNNECRLVILS